MAGRSPVREFLDALSDQDAAAVVAAMRDAAQTGLESARHLRGDIYEIRADGNRQSYRLLFSVEGRGGQVLLGLDGFSKKTQKTPPARIEVALDRLVDWRRRGGQRRSR